LRNEAHRFGITFHRNMRSKKMLGSSLTQIKGLGEKSAKKLISNFGSISSIAAADEIEIEKIVGKKISTLLKNYFINSFPSSEDKQLEEEE
jgi:excinuclease ABC subunit C